jgi:AraC-like DNA-binding protein
LLRDIANPPILAAVAKLREMSDRSLRRQPRQQGIFFRGLLDKLRAHLALKYLRTTKPANEDCAGVGVQRRGKIPQCISPLDEQVAEIKVE